EAILAAHQSIGDAPAEHQAEDSGQARPNGFGRHVGHSLRGRHAARGSRVEEERTRRTTTERGGQGRERTSARFPARIISPRVDRPARTRVRGTWRSNRWAIPEVSNPKTPARAVPEPARVGGGVEQISLATAACRG